MFQGSSETQELRALYDFGTQGSAINSRTIGLAFQASQQVSEVINVDHENIRNNGAEYSPQEERSYADGPASPAAFGEQANVVNSELKEEGSKKAVLKEVLGTNKKSTKGMTDDEKKAVKLEERWKNALREEQRLDKLAKRVSQEEAVTAEVGLRPNFPRKFLCIRPLVYHSITAVPEHRQLFVKMAFWDWVAVCVLLVLNCGIAIGVNYAPVLRDVHITKDINKAQNDVLAAVYLIGIPLSFLIWYWRVYSACSTGRPAQHVLALCGLFIALAQGIFAVVGPTSYGFCGIMLTKWIYETRASGVVAPVAVMTLLWAAQAVFTCFMIVKIFIFYRKDLAARRAARRHGLNVVG